MGVEGREVIHQQSAQLRQIAQRLALHGSGTMWRGPVQRECEGQLRGLESDLNDVARALGVAADYAGVHSVMVGP